jgi:hypothetical protein
LRLLCIARAVLDGTFAAPRDPASAAVHLRPHPSEEGYMDLIVVVIIVALAAIGYAWLALVERA